MNKKETFTCIGLNKDGKNCKRKVSEKDSYCYSHKPEVVEENKNMKKDEEKKDNEIVKGNDEVVKNEKREGLCLGKNKNGSDCQKKGSNNGYCHLHKTNDIVEEVKFTLTITFGNQAENHAGMEKIGEEMEEGLSCQDLLDIRARIPKEYVTEIVNLHEVLPKELQEGNEASVLIIRNGVKLFGVDASELTKEHLALKHDTKALMKGKVVNKHARYNLCYGDFSQEPCYEEGKGRVVDFKDVKLLNSIRERLPKYFGDKTKDLVAELNYYYDINKTYINYHSDLERVIVCAIRLGTTFPLFFNWYLRFEPVYERIDLSLNNGDIYLMSTKAVAPDGRKSSILTLRHAAGLETVLNSKK